MGNPSERSPILRGNVPKGYSYEPPVQEPAVFNQEALTKDGWHFGRANVSEESIGHVDHNPFADPEVAERYRMIYEKAKYECRHIYEPTATWTREEEKAVIRLLDWRVCLWAVCCLPLCPA